VRQQGPDYVRSDGVPNKANLHAARVALWRMVQFIVRESHRVHFKKGYSASDITEQQVFTTAVFFELIGHPARAGTVARRIDLPRETTRRYLRSLVKRKLLKRDGVHYVFAGQFSDEATMRCIAVTKRTADKL